MKRKLLIVSAALVLSLALTACGGETVTKTTDSLKQESPASGTEDETAPERTVTGTMLLDGAETAVYLDVSDTEINFRDSASGGTLLAVAKYPETLTGAAEALKSCDYTDLDGDGNSELTAEFAFADGSTASLVWFHTDGGLIYNGEFSRLPGELPASGGER